MATFSAAKSVSVTNEPSALRRATGPAIRPRRITSAAARAAFLATGKKRIHWHRFLHRRARSNGRDTIRSMRWTAFSLARGGFFRGGDFGVCLRARRGAGFLLANPFREGLDLSRYVVSEKLDGVRAQWDGEKFISRRGNVFAAPEWFAAGLPTARLDGELWGGRGTFEAVSGVVRRARPHDGWRAVRFMVFDAPDEAGDFLARLAALRRIAAAADNPHLQVVAHEPIESGAWLMKKIGGGCGGGRRRADVAAQGIAVSRRARRRFD